MMQQNWNKKPLFSAEDEGGGGGGDPSTERMDALEARLSRMTNMLSNVVDNQQQSQVRSQLSAVENQIMTKIKESEKAEAEAEAALAAAFDNGDGAEVAKAQRKLTEATASRLDAQNDHKAYKARLIEGERRNGGSEGATNLDTSNLDKWKEKHASWYGVDKSMTSKAHEIDAKVREAGVHTVGSQEYFNAIDREMRRLYPDRLNGTPSAAGGGAPAPSNSGGTRISASVMEGWRRMGIDTGDPKVVARMTKHRETLVQKGILPQQAVTGSIRSA